MVKVKLHILVVPFEGEAFDVYRIMDIPHLEEGMTLWGIANSPPGTDASEHTVMAVGWHIQEPEVVQVDLNTENYAKNEGEAGEAEIEIGREFYTRESLLANRYTEWAVVED